MPESDLVEGRLLYGIKTFVRLGGMAGASTAHVGRDPGSAADDGVRSEGGQHARGGQLVAGGGIGEVGDLLEPHQRGGQVGVVEEPQFRHRGDRGIGFRRQEFSGPGVVAGFRR